MSIVFWKWSLTGVIFYTYWIPLHHRKWVLTFGNFTVTKFSRIVHCLSETHEASSYLWPNYHQIILLVMHLSDEFRSPSSFPTELLGGEVIKSILPIFSILHSIYTEQLKKYKLHISYYIWIKSSSIFKFYHLEFGVFSLRIFFSSKFIVLKNKVQKHAWARMNNLLLEMAKNSNILTIWLISLILQYSVPGHFVSLS